MASAGGGESASQFDISEEVCNVIVHSLLISSEVLCSSGFLIIQECTICCNLYTGERQACWRSDSLCPFQDPPEFRLSNKKGGTHPACYKKLSAKGSSCSCDK